MAQEDVNYGGILEALNNKIDLDNGNNPKPHIVETYRNGSSWYRVWSDGWCEQGGAFTSNGGPINQTIYFLKNFVDTEYYFTYTNGWGGYVENGNSVNSRQVGSVFIPWATSQAGNVSRWFACGYIS